MITYVLNISRSNVLNQMFESWSSVKAFSRVMNPASPSGSPTNASEFGGCQENATCPTA